MTHWRGQAPPSSLGEKGLLCWAERLREGSSIVCLSPCKARQQAKALAAFQEAGSSRMSEELRSWTSRTWPILPHSTGRSGAAGGLFPAVEGPGLLRETSSGSPSPHHHARQRGRRQKAERSVQNCKAHTPPWSFSCRLYLQRQQHHYRLRSVTCAGHEVHLSTCSFQFYKGNVTGACKGGMPAVVSCVPGPLFAGGNAQKKRRGQQPQRQVSKGEGRVRSLAPRMPQEKVGWTQKPLMQTLPVLPHSSGSG